MVCLTDAAAQRLGKLSTAGLSDLFEHHRAGSQASAFQVVRDEEVLQRRFGKAHSEQVDICRRQLCTSNLLRHWSFRHGCRLRPLKGLVQVFVEAMLAIQLQRPIQCREFCAFTCQCAGCLVRSHMSEGDRYPCPSIFGSLRLAHSMVEGPVGLRPKPKQATMRQQDLHLSCWIEDTIPQNIRPSRASQRDADDRGILVQVQRLILVVADALVAVRIVKDNYMVEGSI
mmetsp:Transcript_67424/g.158107  ORF Transcript_67424/g.158107 Transcript_67424/m.158107 type:complete len:228 (-) Transcript_67424:539-1222(-)